MVTQGQWNEVEETDTIIEAKELTFKFSFRKTQTILQVYLFFQSMKSITWEKYYLENTKYLRIIY